MSDDTKDPIPAGVCTATKCKCDCFKPNHAANSPMYCAKKSCMHSVEHHHISAKDIQVS